MPTTPHLPLGQLLLKNNLITQTQLDQALEKQKMTGEKLGVVLSQLGFISEENLLHFLAKQLHIPYVNLRTYPLNTEIAKKLPERLARRYRMLLLSEQNQTYLIGMVDPQDIFAIDEATRYFQAPVNVALIKEKDCLENLDLVYRRTDEINKLAIELTDQIQADSVDLDTLEKEFEHDDIPVSKLIRSIFEDAAQIKASDIHIEPEEKALRIRYRVDGILQEHIVKESRIASILVQRLKILSHLNIMEHRTPQDGRFSVKIKNKKFDVRLSAMPTADGESVVMRLLPKDAKAVSLNELQIPPVFLEKIRDRLEAPYGMIIATGPTGSGKTTTLFSLLNELDSPEKKIITIEDPIEYRLPRLIQVQVNPAIDLTFARILRSALRQDPDILMVGEIRDSETLSIALRAAMTGHLVLSTLHTNNTLSSIERMLDLGSEPYLIASALRIIIAQRLLRHLCRDCQIDYAPNEIEKMWLEKIGIGSNITFKIGKGCTYCNGTGYRGRFAIFEVLVLDVAMSNTLRLNNLTEFGKLAQDKFIPLWKSAVEAAIEHKTSLSEALPYIMANEE